MSIGRIRQVSGKRSAQGVVNRDADVIDSRLRVLMELLVDTGLCTVVLQVAGMSYGPRWPRERTEYNPYLDAESISLDTYFPYR
jgi:hypothetical protein